MAKQINWENSAVIAFDKKNLGIKDPVREFSVFIETGSKSGKIICSVVTAHANVPICVAAEARTVGGNQGIFVTAFYSQPVGEAGLTLLLLQEDATRFQPPIKQ